MSNDIRDVRHRVTAELRQPDPPQPDASALARRTDPALNPAPTATASTTAAGQGGIQWVRAVDVLQGRGVRLADLHAASQENLVRRMRHGMSQIATSRRGVARRAVGLPPVATFGQPVAPTQPQAVSR